MAVLLTFVDSDVSIFVNVRLRQVLTENTIEKQSNLFKVCKFLMVCFVYPHATEHRGETSHTAQRSLESAGDSLVTTHTGVPTGIQEGVDFVLAFAEHFSAKNVANTLEGDIETQTSPLTTKTTTTHEAVSNSM